MAKPALTTHVEVNLQAQELQFKSDVNRLVHPFRMVIAGKICESYFNQLLFAFKVKLL